jgi:hypothetical protein
MPLTTNRCSSFFIDQSDGQTSPAPAFQTLLLHPGQAFVAFLNTHPDAAEFFSCIAEFEKQLDDL